MISKFFKIVIVANLIMVIGLGCMYFIKEQKSNVAYVEIGALYKDFKMTKELETKFNSMASSRKSFLDSIELELIALAQNVKKQEEFNRVKNIYIVRKQQFEQDNAAANQQYNEQIMNQMNQYLVDFGKENGYDFIFGANGSGGLMYANEQTFNVTNDVLAYINKKYAGKVN